MTIIDPIISLAFSIHSSPGTYALLLGSGVSRSAQIPTGWEVLGDLTSRLARTMEAPSLNNPFEWFQQTFAEKPDYSIILEKLAPTPADRRNLLNSYFEPSSEEKDRGIKLPTRAHKAIAHLVSNKSIRVILTTNFDRLLEQALIEVGIQPIIISSSESAIGATPLRHSNCTIIKLHGDYLNPDLRNTVDELGTYEQPINDLLDTIIDEYGLIICGWSADWDRALCKAFERAKGRRYALYWTKLKGTNFGESASQLAALRQAIEIEIDDADSFFENLDTKTTILADSFSPDPLSASLAIEELKRYIPETKYRIRTADLITNAVQPILELPEFDLNRPQPTPKEILNRMREYESAAIRLTPLLTTIGLFSKDEDHWNTIESIFSSLATRYRATNGSVVWIEMDLYPLLLGIYSLGLGCIASGNESRLMGLCTKVKIDDHETHAMLLTKADPSILDNDACRISIDPSTRQLTSRSIYLYNLLREHTKPLIPLENEYSRRFDELEFLLSFSIKALGKHPYIGRFIWGSYGRNLNGFDPLFERFIPKLTSVEAFSTLENDLQSIKTSFLSTIRDAYHY